MGNFGRFFNDSDFSGVEDFIDTILATPTENTNTTSDTLSSDFIDRYFDKDQKKESNELSKILNTFEIPQERLVRYNSYDEIFRSVPLIKKIIKTYKPYILQKNPITSSWYILRREEYVDNQKESAQIADDVKKFLINTINQYELLKKLKNQIIHNQLVYGDCFVEVVDLKKESKNIDLKKINIVTESEKLQLQLQNLSSKKDSVTPRYLDSILENIAEVLISNTESTDINDGEEVVTSNALIRIHQPHNIIILETKYGTTLGYLEINKQISKSLQTTNITRTLSDITSRISSLSANITKTNDLSSNKDQIINKILSYILKKVNSSNGEKNIKYKDSVINDLKRFIIEQNLSNNQYQLNPIEVRFIPTSRMVAFSLPSSDNHPYGESLIDPLMLPSKLFILSQLSNVMMKLSRAPLTRKWIIDQGSVQMPGVLLQKLKRELKNNRIAIEDLSSFKSISKIMSDYKDHFILSKDGKRALDVEVASNGDPSIKVADLEDARREIISLSGMPAPYLGYMDTVELREQLIHVNISFATEIADIQENINMGLIKLFDIIAEVENKEFQPSKYYKLTLIPPVVLILQLIEMTMGSVGNILGVLQSAGIPYDPYYFLEKYIPYISWSEFREKSDEFRTLLNTKTNIEQLNAAISQASQPQGDMVM